MVNGLVLFTSRALRWMVNASFTKFANNIRAITDKAWKTVPTQWNVFLSFRATRAVSSTHALITTNQYNAQ